jgi:hypothetical protein
MEKIPKFWDLTDQPQFTEREVEDAKTLMRAFPEPTSIDRDVSGASFLNLGNDHVILIRGSVFPSIKPGETVSLKEIAGCNNECEKCVLNWIKQPYEGGGNDGQID